MKPKWKETEFWVLLLGAAATILAFIADRVDGNVAVIVLAAQSAAYTAYRQLTKRSPTDASLRNAVLGALVENDRVRRAGGNGHGAGGVLPDTHPKP